MKKYNFASLWLPAAGFVNIDDIRQPALSSRTSVIYQPPSKVLCKVILFVLCQPAVTKCHVLLDTSFKPRELATSFNLTNYALSNKAPKTIAFSNLIINSMATYFFCLLRLKITRTLPILFWAFPQQSLLSLIGCQTTVTTFRKNCWKTSRQDSPANTFSRPPTHHDKPELLNLFVSSSPILLHT